MVIVADSSALIVLATCSGLELLTQLYQQVLAKNKGHLNEIEPYLDCLRQSPIYYSEALMNQVLKLAGELP